MTPQARIAHVMRASHGRLLAILASRTRDILAAEDALSDAYEIALTAWTKTVPDNPEAWLLTTARRRLIDRQRRAAREDLTDTPPETVQMPHDPDALPDDRLKLMFVCAHPAIDRTLHTPLMLQCVLGLDSDQIGRAFLVSPQAMAQRLVRAKRKIKDAGIAFRIPEAPDLSPRVAAVLEAIYGAHAADWFDGGDLAEEALWLANLLVRLLPDDAEALGLSALMSFSLARRQARVRDGVLVPVHEQDTALWDIRMIRVALSQLARAKSLDQLGRFQLEAAIQSVHIARAETGQTDWHALHRLHAGLAHLAPTIGAAVGHAVAAGFDAGPDAGLALLDKIAPDAVAGFAPALSAKAFLLARSGQPQKAAQAYDMAIKLTTEPPLRRYLQAQRAALPLI